MASWRRTAEQQFCRRKHSLIDIRHIVTLPLSPFSALAHLLQIKSLGDGRLHLSRLLVHQVEVDLTFSTMVVDSLLVLDESAQVFNVCLQEDLCQGVGRVKVPKR